MANIFTQAARWMRGAINGQERRNPKTGIPEIRLGRRGGWFDPHADERPRPTNASQHPKPPRGLVGVASRAIGTGRVGVGERIGTGLGTELASGGGGTGRAGPGGVIGMTMRIGEARGSSSGGSSSGS